MVYSTELALLFGGAVIYVAATIVERFRARRARLILERQLAAARNDLLGGMIAGGDELRAAAERTVSSHPAALPPSKEPPDVR